MPTLLLWFGQIENCRNLRTWHFVLVGVVLRGGFQLSDYCKPEVIWHVLAKFSQVSYHVFSCHSWMYEPLFQLAGKRLEQLMRPRITRLHNIVCERLKMRINSNNTMCWYTKTFNRIYQLYRLLAIVTSSFTHVMKRDLTKDSNPNIVLFLHQ